MPYFERLDDRTFVPTSHVGGAWALDEQHVAPSMGLLCHLVETDHAARRPGALLQVSRLSYDILGTLRLDEVTTRVDVRRAGRTIELVEATMSQAGRDAVVLRAWLVQPTPTTAHAGTALDPIPGPDRMEPWDPTTVWGGGFIASADVRRHQQEPGRAQLWVRTDVPLLDEPVSPTAALAGLVDIANGMTVRTSPEVVAFPNLDLTAHLVRPPRPSGPDRTGQLGWLGFDTSVTFGPGGHGLTSSVLHDQDGPLGTLAQVLTLRPRR